jgi:hypothetical protein
MFTGTITAVGTIRELRNQGDLRAVIECPYDSEQIAIGASIACSGVCLTVVERGVLRQAQDERGFAAWFAVDVSGETISKTAQDQWQAGRKLNLEQALKNWAGTSSPATSMPWAGSRRARKWADRCTWPSPPRPSSRRLWPPRDQSRWTVSR